MKLACTLLVLAAVGCASTAPPVAAPMQADGSGDGASGCDASNTRINPKPPTSGWKAVGRVSATFRDKHLVTVEARNASGEMLERRSVQVRAAAKNRKDAEEEIARGICRAGGALGAANEGLSTGKWKSGDGVMVIDALVPLVEDERADLEQICRFDVPAVSKEHPEPELDPTRAMAVASAELIWLTTRRWRTWEHAVEESVLPDAPNRDAQVAAAHAKADELEAIAKQRGFASCTYVGMLRAMAEHPAQFGAPR